MNAVTPIEAEAPPAPQYLAIADLLSSGLSGLELTTALASEFPDATRWEVYMALAIASTLWWCDLQIARAETAAVQQGGRH